MELNALKQRNLEYGQLDVADDGDVARVDHVTQCLRRTNAILPTHTHVTVFIYLYLIITKSFVL